jgi:hypothetical protein
MVRTTILPAAAALLLNLASAATAAQSPSDVAAAVRVCKAIPDNEQRLKCFDDLFAEKPSAPNNAEKSGSQTSWSIEEGKSPTDNSPEVTAAMVSGDTALILRCKEQNTEAAFSTKYNYLGSKSVDLLVQNNDAKPTNDVWRASTTGRAAFAPNAAEFIRSLPDNGKLFIRTTRFAGKTKDGNFKLGAVSQIREKLAAPATGLMNLPRNLSDRLNPRKGAEVLSNSAA